MTNEEAIKILKQYLDIDSEVKSEYLEAQRMAIKALEQQAVEKDHEIDVTYICDGKKCQECSKLCNHTTDISHAINFEPVMSIDGETVLNYEEKMPRYKPIILQEHDAERRTMRTIIDTTTEEIYINKLTMQGAELLGMTIEEVKE